MGSITLRGAQDLGVINILINSALDGRNACYMAYVKSSNWLYLLNNAGDQLGTGMAVDGSSGTLSNSQGTISGSGSSANSNGNTFTLTLSTTFSSTFGGNKVFYLAARDIVERNSGWQRLGIWQVPGGGSTGTITVAGMSPARGSGNSGTFSFTIDDTAGWQHIGVVNVLLNTALDGRNACYMAYVRSTNWLYLMDDPNGALGPGMALNGTPGALSNSQCTVNNASSWSSGSANQVRRQSAQNQ